MTLIHRARAMAELKQARGWHGVVAGTRKTTPGVFELSLAGFIIRRLWLFFVMNMRGNSFSVLLISRVPARGEVRAAGGRR